MKYGKTTVKLENKKKFLEYVNSYDFICLAQETCVYSPTAVLSSIRAFRIIWFYYPIEAEIEIIFTPKNIHIKFDRFTATITNLSILISVDDISDTLIFPYEGNSRSSDIQFNEFKSHNYRNFRVLSDFFSNISIRDTKISTDERVKVILYEYDRAHSSGISESIFFNENERRQTSSQNCRHIYTEAREYWVE